MEFLKEILGEELYAQFAEKLNAYNGDAANKDKQIKLANLGGGEYVGKGKYDALQAMLDGKETELTTANGLIADLKKGTKGNEELQGKSLKRPRLKMPFSLPCVMQRPLILTIWLSSCARSTVPMN